MGHYLFLNLDAEDELAALRRGVRYASPDRVLAAIDAAAARLAPSLPPDLEAWSPSRGRPPGPAVAWSPTPSAVDACGVEGPSVEALAAANDRATFHALDPLPGSTVARSLDEVLEHLAGATPGSRWRLRRGLSSAGRSARPVVAGSLPEGDAEWVRAALASGPITVDPKVAVLREYAVHGELDRRGAVGQASRPCVVQVDGHGQFVSARRTTAGELESSLEKALTDALELVGSGLRDVGYAGPFGVDAFEWRDTDGTVRLHAPSEVNARYTMSWWL